MTTSVAITPKTFEALRPRFVELTDEQTYQREVSFACQILAKNDYLAKAQTASIQLAVMNVAQIGLSLNPALKLAYLVPRYSRKLNGVECSLEPSYQGLVKLLTDCGTVKSIEARIVWAGDDFDFDFASSDKVTKHKPYILTGKPRGDKLAVYSIAILADGSKSVEIMSREDVEAIRERSESYQKAKGGTGGMSSTWITDEAEMWRKSVIKRHFKYLPKSGGAERVAEAIEIDSTDYPCTHSQWGLVDTLLRTATISEDEKAKIEREVCDYTSIEASRAIEYLQNNQPVDDARMVREIAQEATVQLPDLTPNHEKWAAIAAKVKAGTSMETIRKHYNVSDEHSKLLTANI